MTTARIRTAVFISGGGSNMAALIEAARAPEYPAEIVLVVSDEPGAGGLEKARTAGVEACVIDRRAYPDRAAFDAALTQAAEDAGCEIICLAGFMRLLTPGFVEHWQDRLLNIHPSLLPKFKGLNTHARALAAGEAEHGCTVHLVRAEMDTGPIIEQAKVPVLADDTPETLAARVLAEEHRIYPLALARVLFR
ncbi:MAG: phosphoribosylglycinamide formyltransferase [Rhodospirillales bacterium]